MARRKARHFILGWYDPENSEFPVHIFGKIWGENNEDLKTVKRAIETIRDCSAKKDQIHGWSGIEVGLFPIHIETSGRPFVATARAAAEFAEGATT
jgi:hypothetical protein